MVRKNGGKKDRSVLPCPFSLAHRVSAHTKKYLGKQLVFHNKDLYDGNAELN
jgi:hypothetical protein